MSEEEKIDEEEEEEDTFQLTDDQVADFKDAFKKFDAAGKWKGNAECWLWLLLRLHAALFDTRFFGALHCYSWKDFGRNE